MFVTILHLFKEKIVIILLFLDKGINLCLIMPYVEGETSHYL